MKDFERRIAPVLEPYGVCLLYADARWHGECGLEHHEHNRLNAEDVECLPMLSAGYERRFEKGARALDSGGRPNPVLMPMACEAVETVLRWRPRRVQDTLRAHTDRVAERAAELGLRVPSRRAGHMCGVDRPGDAAWADRCSHFLKARGVVVASRFGKLRVAPHVYNTRDEVQLLCDLLVAFEVSEGRRRRSSKL